MSGRFATDNGLTVCCAEDYDLFQLDLPPLQVPEEQAGYRGSKRLVGPNEAFRKQYLLHPLAVLGMNALKGDHFDLTVEGGFGDRIAPFSISATDSEIPYGTLQPHRHRL